MCKKYDALFHSDTVQLIGHYPLNFEKLGIDFATCSAHKFHVTDHLADDEFFRLWHDEHTPFSFEFHPRRWRYERNVVARVLTPGAPPYRGIVNESWPEFEDFLDMDRYVPEELRAPSDDRVEGFIGLDALHLTVTSEYILRSFPT